ncbi:MAG TPA: transferrin receptor-like dimerization domain-containing protein [Gammaproteobacteria bacterium]|jgi:N-acetylated-alpha-linked acidic dipeptidase|nr:transferrin receptor-like dimerization domain-containing protein [Gammaproteobacteria bacterium]
MRDKSAKLTVFLAATGLTAASLGALAADGTPPMQGFTAADAAQQTALEQKFDAALSADDQRDWNKDMSSEHNEVGSPHDKANADTMLKQFQSWGWDAHIETFYVLYPTPKEESLELVGPTQFKATLHEPPVDGDATSQTQADKVLPPYNAYGADGDVTADVVYVNYGMPDDYKELARHGVDVKGKIVIARYGAGWRGLKPKLAYEHGAVGCIIYSDPRDDGYWQGDVYPKGAFRSADGVQRGSVADMPIYPGDPLTPGYGSTKDAKRLALKDAKTILKTPVLPISYADAKPFLSALEGPVAPANWRGALPITYHIGPGPAKAHLVVQSNWDIKPIYDVIATIKGSEYPDQWVMRGNHHDGWAIGADDPLSGNVALLDEAKAIGALLKTGWKPKRTLVYASWDGEEPGLLGSTEWAETHAEELQKKLVIYINTDNNSRGFLGASGSHSVQTMFDQETKGVTDPETGVSIDARLRAAIETDGFGKNASAEDVADAKTAASGEDLPLGALGSGSDYTAFLDHLGIASLDIGFHGEGEGGDYHSLYDSFDHYSRFGDPGFKYGIAMSKIAGHTALRFADADVVPFSYGAFADTVGSYVTQLHGLAEGMRLHNDQQNKLLAEHAFTLAADPTLTYVPPPAAQPAPFLNFAPLDNAMLKLKASAAAYDAAYAAASAQSFKPDADKLAALNRQLQGMEQDLLYSGGLPGRSWFKHMIYAAGLYTGYGAKTLPGVREAIEEQQWDTATQYIDVDADTLTKYSAELDKATALLKQ